LCDDVGGTAYGGRLKLGIDSVAWAPPVQLRLSIGGRAGDMEWPMRRSPSNTPDPSSPPPPKPANALAVRIGAVLILVGLGAVLYYYFTEVK
jgi:hypothetical protein